MFESVSEAQSNRKDTSRVARWLIRAAPVSFITDHLDFNGFHSPLPRRDGFKLLRKVIILPTEKFFIAPGACAHVVVANYIAITLIQRSWQ